jgi:hypothetical protein
MTRRNFFSVLLTAPVLFWNRLKGTVTPTASLPLPAPPIKRNHEEWLRCKADPVYFLEQHFKIVNSTEGLIPVKLLPWQKEVAYAYQEKNVVANVARQSGKNVIVAGLILHRLLFFENAVIGVVSPKMMTTADLLQMLKLAYEQLPEWLRPGVLRWNRENVLLVNGNRLVCFAGREPFRGYSLTDVFVNEAAYCEESVIQTGLLPRSTAVGISSFRHRTAGTILQSAIWICRTIRTRPFTRSTCSGATCPVELTSGRKII